MAETWWLIENADGTYRQVATDGVNPSKAGEKGVAHAMTRRGNLELETPSIEDGTWSPNLSALKAKAVEEVERQRVALQDALVSEGEGKKLVYAQKAAEQLDYFTNPGVQVNRDRFPAAYIESDVTGDSVVDVLHRFREGAKRSAERLYLIEAIAQQAKSKIYSATTVVELDEASPSWPESSSA